jgi:hypothetical protein
VQALGAMRKATFSAAVLVESPDAHLHPFGPSRLAATRVKLGAVDERIHRPRAAAGSQLRLVEPVKRLSGLSLGFSCPQRRRHKLTSL